MRNRSQRFRFPNKPQYVTIPVKLGEKYKDKDRGTVYEISERYGGLIVLDEEGNMSYVRDHKWNKYERLK